MGVVLAGWNNDGACVVCDCTGGVARTAILERCELTGVTIGVGGEVTAITIATPGAAAIYTHSTNETARYDQTGSRTTGGCYRSDQLMTGEFTCVNAATIKEANELIETKDVIAFHEQENGITVVQGIDIVDDGAGGFVWKKSLKNAEMIIDSTTGTTAEEGKITFKVQSTGRNLSCSSTFTVDDVAAL